MSDEQVVEPSQPAGLLDGVEATEESQQEPSEASAVDHRADDSIPEDEPLDRPDWWPEHFWNEGEPDLQGISKSWMDMRQMVSQGKHTPFAFASTGMALPGRVRATLVAGTLAFEAAARG